MSDAPPKLPPKPLPSDVPPPLPLSRPPSVPTPASPPPLPVSRPPSVPTSPPPPNPNPNPARQGDDATEGHRAREGKIAAGGGQGSGRAQPSLKPSNPFAGGAAKPHRYAGALPELRGAHSSDEEEEEEEEEEEDVRSRILHERDGNQDTELPPANQLADELLSSDSSSTSTCSCDG